jgi:NitT/TauT family transport system substrate-binding protein
LTKKIEFSDYTDTRFSDEASIQTPWRYEPGTARAR